MSVMFTMTRQLTKKLHIVYFSDVVIVGVVGYGVGVGFSVGVGVVDVDAAVAAEKVRTPDFANIAKAKENDLDVFFSLS